MADAGIALDRSKDLSQPLDRLSADDALRWGGARGVLSVVVLVEALLGTLSVGLMFLIARLRRIALGTFTVLLLIVHSRFVITLLGHHSLLTRW